MINNLLLLASAIYIYVDAMRTLKGLISSKVWNYVSTVLVINFICSTCCSYRSLDICKICYRNLADMRFSWPDGCRKLIFKSCSTLHSLTTPIYHFSLYLHATYLFRRRDSVVILPKHASPVMLNELASASSSAVRLYELEFTGLKKW